MSEKWYKERQLDGLELAFKVAKNVASKQSKYQKIDIIDTKTHGRILALDEKIMTTQADEFIYHEMITQVPLNSHHNPKVVLVIGGGDGGTVREVLKHDSVKKVDLCEIDEMVVEMSKKYMPFLAAGFSDPRAKVYIEDGFEYLQRKENQEKYDVILVDSTDPVGVAEKLFGEDFYQLAKNCLNKEGTLCGQCESPFFFQQAIIDAHNNLRRQFQVVLHYTAPVPTYPSGYWSFVLASDKSIECNEKAASTIGRKCEYYNEEIHKACFALPNLFKRLLKN